MLSTSQVMVIVVGVAVGVFVMYPPPPLSPRLLAWKQKGKMFRHNNLDVFYMVEQGQGSSGHLICLHGFPSLSYDWIKILPTLKKHYSQILMIDFLGHGFSDKLEHYNYSIFDQADMVESLAHSLGMDDAHLLAHDYGDTVALEMTARFMERSSSSSTSGLILRSLCLLNGGLFPGKYYPILLQRVLLLPIIGNIAGRLTSSFTFHRSFSGVFGSNKPSSEDLDDFYAALRYNDGNLATPGILRYISERTANEKRWVGALTNSPFPVLMIYGPADPVNPPPFAEYFREIAPRHSIIELDDLIGHYPQWEDPDNVAKGYSNFINSIKST